jgi:hypothetical protein
MPLGIEATRLEERRLGVLDTAIDAELRLGRHQVLVSELSGLVARHPMNENLRAKYMIALYRPAGSGRLWTPTPTCGAPSSPSSRSSRRGGCGICTS